MNTVPIRPGAYIIPVANAILTTTCLGDALDAFRADGDPVIGQGLAIYRILEVRRRVIVLRVSRIG